MQIEKINENQLEVTLNLEDLKKNNISLHSFMCNSIKSQNLFFEILDFANKEIGFTLKNYEIIIEAFSIPTKNYFILLITRIPKKNYLRISKKKYRKFNISKSFWIKFNFFEDLCMFCNSIESNLQAVSSLYLLNNNYFLHIKFINIRDYIKFILNAHEFSNCLFNNNFILDENAESIIKNCAIETSKKYFV